MTDEKQSANSKLLPIAPFLPTERLDFNISWGEDKVWKERHEKVMGTTAEEPLGVLGLYWKYAWNTARSPWMLTQLFEAIEVLQVARTGHSLILAWLV